MPRSSGMAKPALVCFGADGDKHGEAKAIPVLRGVPRRRVLATLAAMKRLLCFLILIARLPGAETVDLSAVHPHTTVRRVDLSGIPADLTLVMSTLAAPMGGMAFDPRQPVELVFHPRLAMAEKGVTGITARMLPGGQWRLVCGELAGETGEVIVMGQRLSITKGADSAAGRLVGKFLAREHFTQLAAESDAGVRKELRTDPQCAPFLTAATAFIVLEEEWQYRQFGIPLPPDLAKKDEPRGPGAQEQADQDEFDAFIKELRRRAGTASDPYADLRIS